MSRTILDRLFESPEDSTQFAQDFAAILQRGDVVLLTGGIGAGKTHFARGVIQALLTVPEDVPSPTFTLVQTYETSIGPVWHADLYRLTNADEVAELGLIDAFGVEVCLIEWPDRLGPDAPDAAVSLEFSTTEIEGQRRMRARATNPAWDERLKVLTDD